MVEAIVTGASGFVGKHLTARLEDVATVPHEQIPTYSLPEFKNFYFLSSYGNMAFQKDDKEIRKANVLDVVTILDKIDPTQGFDSFVYLSSSSVKLKTQTTYSRCKRAAEEVLLSFMETHNLPVCIIRPFSITGVGEQPQHLIPTLIRSCFTGEKVNFVPHPAHDFIDVDDVVSGILCLSEHKARGIFELGSGVQYTNDQVLDIVETVTGKRANINLVQSMRDYDTQEWMSLNYRARGYGWLPKKSLVQSVTEMVKEYKSEY